MYLTIYFGRKLDGGGKVTQFESLKLWMKRFKI